MYASADRARIVRFSQQREGSPNAEVTPLLIVPDAVQDGNVRSSMPSIHDQSKQSSPLTPNGMPNIRKRAAVATFALPQRASGNNSSPHGRSSLSRASNSVIDVDQVVQLSGSERAQLEKLHRCYLQDADAPGSIERLLARVNPSASSSAVLLEQLNASLTDNTGAGDGRRRRVSEVPRVLQLNDLLHFALHVKKLAARDILSMPGLRDQDVLPCLRGAALSNRPIGFDSTDARLFTPLDKLFSSSAHSSPSASSRLAERQKALEAFANLGGKPDGSGTVELHALQGILDEFGLHITLSEYTGRYIDHYETGEVDFEEFEWLFRNGISIHKRRRARGKNGLGSESVMSFRTSAVGATTEAGLTQFLGEGTEAGGKFWMRGYGDESVARRSSTIESVSAMTNVSDTNGSKGHSSPKGIVKKLVLEGLKGTGTGGGERSSPQDVRRLSAAQQPFAQQENPGIIITGCVGARRTTQSELSKQRSPLIDSPLMRQFRFCGKDGAVDDDASNDDEEQSWFNDVSLSRPSLASTALQQRLDDVLNTHTTAMRRLSKREQRRLSSLQITRNSGAKLSFIQKPS